MHTGPRRARLPWPALVLYFLSPVVGELLSSSSPPVEFFTVFGLTVMSLLYGSGALLVRELAFRWGTGWPGRLLLGAAYGIVEEGLMVKSFFDPNWQDLGILGSYGRMYGVNWVWSLELTIYHCLFSICIPIVLTELAFPRWRDRPWLRMPGLIVFAVLLLADVAFGFIALTPFRPPIVPYFGAVVAVAGLVAAARLVRPPAGFFLGLRELVRAFSWTPANQWALASGALAFFVVLSPLVEMDGNRTDDTTGMTVVGLVMAGLLLAGFLKVRREGAIR